MSELPQHAAFDWRTGSPDPAASMAWRAARRGPEAPPAIASISRMLVAVLNAAIWLYQHTLSPALAVAAPSCGCRFAPTCSHYAQDALREHGLLRGLALAARRLAKCGPWHPGGIDPVPPRRFSCTSVKPPARAEAERALLTTVR